MSYNRALYCRYIYQSMNYIQEMVYGNRLPMTGVYTPRLVTVVKKYIDNTHLGELSVAQAAPVKEKDFISI